MCRILIQKLETACTIILQLLLISLLLQLQANATDSFLVHKEFRVDYAAM